MTKQRRHFAGTEKVAILKRHLLDKVAISDLCDELGLYPKAIASKFQRFFTGFGVELYQIRADLASPERKSPGIQRF